MAAVGLVGLAAMFGAVSANVLAVNFTTMDNSFQLYSNYLDAKYAAGFLTSSTRKAASTTTCAGASTATSQCGVAEVGINTASLAGLCGIVPEKISILGVSTDYYLLLTAGEGVSHTITASGMTSYPQPTSGTLSVSATDGTINQAGSTGIVKANNLFLSATSLSGFGNLISGLNLGQDASAVANYAGLNGGSSPGGPGGTGSWPTGPTGANPQPTPGNFGLYATQLNVGGLDGSSYGINLAGSITLPNLKLQVKAGSNPDVNAC